MLRARLGRRADLMPHATEIKGSDLECWWFTCLCGEEGDLWTTREGAELDASVHLVVSTEELG